jgi:predicted DNA-binding antitoxin AbrB/MazE fold protein
MLEPIRAIYSKGKLQLLEPVELTEGEEIQLVILSGRERVRAALSKLLVEIPEAPNDQFDEAELMREIEEGFMGTTLSDIIIEERREGP